MQMSAFGNLLNGELASRMKPHMKSSAKKAKAEEVLAERYAFHMSVVKSFIRYSQTVENKSRKEVTTAVAKVVDSLTTEYGFGAKFVQEINKYILDSYQKSANQIENEIRVNSKLHEESFEYFMDEMKDNKLVNNFSPRFKAILNS
jgi:AAA+ ATPase superfamily predicted ATPase